MAEGVKTYMGLAVPLVGESEIVQETAATDILTITGAASQEGDFLVCQNSTGGENLVISSSGAVTSVVGGSFTSGTFSGVLTSVLASSGASGISLSVSTTGAIAAGAVLANGVVVSTSSKANMNSVFAYINSTGGTAGVANYLLGCHGSKSPDYFLGIGATAIGVGAPADNGFMDTNVRFLGAPATTNAFTGLKVLGGTAVFWVLAAPATIVEVA